MDAEGGIHDTPRDVIQLSHLFGTFLRDLRVSA
jgi:hypothetical protein